MTNEALTHNGHVFSELHSYALEASSHLLGGGKHCPKWLLICFLDMSGSAEGSDGAERNHH